MQVLKPWQEEPLALSLKMGAEVIGFLGPNEQHQYMQVLPVGNYEFELIQCDEVDIVVLDAFNEPLTELRGNLGDSETFDVKGRGFVIVEVKNATRGEVSYSFKLQRNPRGLLIREDYSA